jgi:hypothetical protein
MAKATGKSKSSSDPITEQIKDAARGRWREILIALAGLNPKSLDAKNGPCPRCGDGTNRLFTQTDFLERGGVGCRKCQPKDCHDGIASLEWLNGWKFNQIRKELAKYLGLEIEFTKPKPPKLTTKELNEELAGLWCIKKQPIRVDALKRIGARSGTHHSCRKDFSVICLPILRDSEPTETDFQVYHSSGGKLPVWDANSKTEVFEKVKNLGKKGAVGDSFERVKKSNTVVITEGGTDALALLSQSDLPEDWAVTSLSNGASCNADSWFLELLRGKVVWVVYDVDDAGRKGAAKLLNSLHGIASSCKEIRLADSPPAEKTKIDLRDWLTDGGTVPQLRELAANAPEWVPIESAGEEPKQTRDTSRRVVVDLNESRVANEVISKLAVLEGEQAVYQRGGILVSIVKVEDKDVPAGTLKISSLPYPIIRERIVVAAELGEERETEEGLKFVPIRPPKWLIDAVANRGEYSGIRPLCGIVQTPTIRPDGSILQTPGYDESTGLVFAPLIEYPKVPESPNRQNAIDAAEMLLDVFQDFPFQDDSDKSANLAKLLTMVGRPAVNGCCPVPATTATVRGTGKTLLDCLNSIIAFGKESAIKTFPREPKALADYITTAAIEARPYVLFDNVDAKFGNAEFDAAVTSRFWNDRIKGVSKSTGDIPLKTIFSVTGNNLQFRADTARRVLPIRLVSDMENPEERSDFAYPNLLDHVTKNRAQLAVAALTILRAYFAAGCPEVDKTTWGSFESWHRVIRGAVCWLGLADPMATRETAKAQDESAEALGLLIAGLAEACNADPFGRGLSSQQICDEAANFPILKEALSVAVGEKPSSRSVGNVLKKFSGRIQQNQRISSRDGRSNRKVWFVEAVSMVGVVSHFSTTSRRGEIEEERDSNSNIEDRRISTNHSNHSNQTPKLAFSKADFFR